MCGIFILVKTNKKPKEYEFKFNLFDSYLNSPYLINHHNDFLQELLQKHNN